MNALTMAVAKHAEGLVALRRNSPDIGENLLLESMGLSFTVWTLFDLAAFYSKASRLELATEYWQKLEDRRGIILRRWFTGTIVLTRLNLAVTAQRRGEQETAHDWAQKVLDYLFCRFEPGKRSGVLSSPGVQYVVGSEHLDHSIRNAI